MSNIEIKTIKSPYNIICSIIIYIIGTFILPMYKLSSVVILLIISVIVYFVLLKLNVFKDQQIEVEVPINYDSPKVEQLIELASGKINTLKEVTNNIESNSLLVNLNSIINTSNEILELIKEHQDIAMDTKKYFRYYLDEVINIVNSYKELEDSSMDVDSIKNSKLKIENTISNADASFKKYYDNLIAGKMMDVEVDLNVFEGMLNEIK